MIVTILYFLIFSLSFPMLIFISEIKISSLTSSLLTCWPLITFCVPVDLAKSLGEIRFMTMWLLKIVSHDVRVWEAASELFGLSVCLSQVVI